MIIDDHDCNLFDLGSDMCVDLKPKPKVLEVVFWLMLQATPTLW